jgi:farnesol dehydrogenase
MPGTFALDRARTVALTGATGYLGRHVVAALRKRGLSVRCVVRDVARAAAEGLAAGDGIELVAGDVTSRPSIDAAFAGAGAVVHGAATVTSWERDRTTFDRVNVEGLQTVLRAAADAGVPRVVFVSSFFALGPTDGITGDETLPVDPARRFHNDYERTKTLAEAEAREQAGRGYPLVTVYPGVLMGPGPLREANLVSGMVRDAAEGRLPGLPGGGNRRWCFTWVEDAAEGVARALEAAADGDRFVLGGENASLRDFFDRVEARGGPRVPRRSIPFAVLKAAGAASEALAFLGGPRPKLTRGAVSIFRHDWAYSSRRAARALGWTARSLDDAVRGLLDSMRAAGQIR